MNSLYSQKHLATQARCVPKRFVIILGLLTFLSLPGFSQLYQFTQYYNTLQLINPAFVGSTGHLYKVSSITRLQWVNIANNFPVLYQTHATSGQFILGHPLGKSESNVSESTERKVFAAVGLSFIRNNQGDGSLKYTSILPAGSMMARIGAATYLSIGVEVNFSQYSLDNYILVNDYLHGNFVDNPVINENSKTISSGFMLVTNRFWVGFSFKDILLQSFTNGNILIDTDSRMYDNIYLNGGVNFPWNEDEYRYITSSFLFKKRSQNVQLEGSLGFVKIYQSGYAWSVSGAYRGLWKNEDDLKNIDAVAFIAGINIPNYSIFHKKNRNSSNKAGDWGDLSINFSTDFLHAQFKDSYYPRTWEISIILNAPSRRGEYSKICGDLHGPLAEQITQNFYSGKDPYINSYKQKHHRKPKK